MCVHSCVYCVCAQYVLCVHVYVRMQPCMKVKEHLVRISSPLHCVGFQMEFRLLDSNTLIH